MRLATLALLAGLLLLHLAPVAAAGAQSPSQRRLSSSGAVSTRSLDVGAASIRYDEFLRSGAVTITPALRVRREQSLMSATGSASVFQSGSVSLQGDLAGSAFTRPFHGLSLELSGGFGLNSYRAQNLMAVAQGGVFLHVAGSRAGAQAGGLAGYAAGSFTEAVSAEPGFMRGRFVAWAAPSTRGAPRLELTVSPTAAGIYRYSDAEAVARWAQPRWELTASAGTRLGERSIVEGSVRRWVEGSAAVRLTRRFAVAAAGGSYPPDLAQGIPGARYVALSARVTSRPRLSARAGGLRVEQPPAVLLPVPDIVPVPTDFVLRDAGEGRQTIRIRPPADSVAAVEIMGDFTGWEPVALVRAADGMWQVTLPVALGAHRINVRFDSGDWTVPAGLATQEDDFGGKVGVFTVR